MPQAGCREVSHDHAGGVRVLHVVPERGAHTPDDMRGVRGKNGVQRARADVLSDYWTVTMMIAILKVALWKQGGAV